MKQKNSGVGRTQNINRREAELTMNNNGWLSTQPVDFREEVLRRSLLIQFDAEEYIYRMGDSLGGIYGLVKGNLTINTAPPGHLPRLIQTGIPGSWTGEGCFLTRQPRRLDLQARLPTWMFHLPLEQMDQMAYSNPKVIAQFSHILMATTEVLVRIVSDLQVQDSVKRIASVLQRITGDYSNLVVLTQSELGEMSCATRRQVNIALRKLSFMGILKVNYGRINIIDREKLVLFLSKDS
ncbi:Crp/Fnr family transcriptional regulator [Ochrobactrum sp. S46]|nr:Crp/Fnr family transcriptional regulator [Ochrobactrum sp. S45]MBK0043666.1 Crp/Fnr family transcriptional regulator [Ochrobactrum sp. S46]